MAWILNSVTDGKGGGAGIEQWKKKWSREWLEKRNMFQLL